jgi:hypothetical protein
MRFFLRKRAESVDDESDVDDGDGSLKFFLGGVDATDEPDVLSCVDRFSSPSISMSSAYPGELGRCVDCVAAAAAAGAWCC